MARLRKPSTLVDPVLMPPPTTSKPARTSPRKAQNLRETPSKRSLRYESDQDDEPSILIPKVPASGAGIPKQRIRVLRPVASNSKLLRRLSDESIRSPEKRCPKERGIWREEVRGSRYSKDLARVVGRRGARSGRIEGRVEMEKEVEVDGDVTKLEMAMENAKVDMEEEIEETLNEDEELDQSLLCDEEEEEEEVEEAVVPVVEEDDNEEAVLEQQIEPEIEEDEVEEDEDDEDEDPVVNIRNQRRRVQTRVIDSDSEEEDQDPVVVVQSRNHQVPLQAQTKAVKPEPEPASLTSMRPPFRKNHSTISNWAQEVIDLTDSPEPPASFVLPALPPPRVLAQPLLPSASTSRPTSSATNDADALLHFSPTPTKQRSPRKAPPMSRPSTPPTAPPSPTKLVSPSKKKPRIPPVPALRPSLDAFWSHEVVNDWNNKHSPSKPLCSPKKEKWLQCVEKQDLGHLSDSDISFVSPTTSPRKNKHIQSSIKDGSIDSPTVTQIRAQRKAFSAEKHVLAEAFLKELDSTITSLRISTLSRHTGGIKLIWSKTLKTTAGRANWRRETFRVRNGPLPTDFREEARHHCSIELAEKVIDDEDRLYNVLAHEFCHLTTFMISEQRKNPHGAEFKAWGKKVSTAFGDKGVEVTTKHTYQIEYKYIWRCGVCAYEFKRHSKSIDPQRHSCGRCKGKLIQIKPTPRGAGKGGVDGKPKEKSGYQVFVKANFGKVKREMEAQGLDVQMGKVMEAVARAYREEKGRKEVKGGTAVDEVELAFGGMNIGDE